MTCLERKASKLVKIFKGNLVDLMRPSTMWMSRTLQIWKVGILASVSLYLLYACLSICISECVCAYMYASVCVCVSERKRACTFVHMLCMSENVSLHYSSLTFILTELFRTTLSVFKRLDVVVNNAGVGFEVENSPANMWRKTIDINLVSEYI